MNYLNLPASQAPSSGSLKLTIDADYRSMKGADVPKDMVGGSSWTKQSNEILDEFKLEIDQIAVTTDSLNGVWTGNNGGVYIVFRDWNSDNIGWIAMGPHSEWAHVAMGQVNGNDIKMKWGELLIGSQRRHGTLQCHKVSDDAIALKSTGSDGVFVTNVITRNRTPTLPNDDEKKHDVEVEPDKELKESMQRLFEQMSASEQQKDDFKVGTLPLGHFCFDEICCTTRLSG